MIFLAANFLHDVHQVIIIISIKNQLHNSCVLVHVMTNALIGGANLTSVLDLTSSRSGCVTSISCKELHDYNVWASKYTFFSKYSHLNFNLMIAPSARAIQELFQSSAHFID
jgi:hypothetical protein